MLLTPSLKMLSVFLCACVLTTVTSKSLLDLEAKVNDIRAILERGENTTKQHGLEISELKKELNSVNNRPISSDRLDKLKRKLVEVSSQLESLTSGQETVKIERNGIFEELRQVNRWSKALISKTERKLENAIANFSTGYFKKELDYKEFKTQVLEEWDQWWRQTRETVSRVIAEFEQSKADLQAQRNKVQAEFEELKADLQTQQSQIQAEFEQSNAELQAKRSQIQAQFEKSKADLEQQSKIETEFDKSKAVLPTPQPSPTEAEMDETNKQIQTPQNQTQSRADSLVKHSHCRIDYGKGWIKYGRICYKGFKERVPFDEAKSQCEGFGARLMYPQEYKVEMFKKTGVQYVWVGVRQEGDQPLKYINGTEAELSIVPIFKDYCVLANNLTPQKIAFFSMDCKFNSSFMCVKTQQV